MDIDTSERLIVSKRELSATVEKARSGPSSHTIVFTAGSFDLLHAGHVTYLERAAKHGHYLFVGVQSDTLLKEQKRRPPILTESIRVRTIMALACVDYAFIFYDIAETLALLRPDTFVISDTTDPERNQFKRTIAIELGIRTLTIPSTSPVHTSTIVQNIVMSFKHRSDPPSS